MTSILLLGKLTDNMPFLGNITSIAKDWQRSTDAIGGYSEASFHISNLSRGELVDFYNENLGCIIRETSYGLVTWEGMIVEMRLIINDVEYIRTLDADWFHNKVGVIYSSGPNRLTIPFDYDQESIDTYGEMQYIISLAGATSEAATALRDRHLKEFAWPRSRMVGPIPFGYWTRKQQGLHVMCLGLWNTLNWRYHTTANEDQASTSVVALVQESEFISAGTIEDNTMTVRVDGDPRPIRLGDAIADIAEQGDINGNMWQAGVYNNRQLVYEQAPQEVDYVIRGGILTERVGSEIPLSFVKPGKLVRNDDAPRMYTANRAGDIWNDPTVAYIESVTFRTPNELSLRLYGKEPLTSTLQLHIARGFSNVTQV